MFSIFNFNFNISISGFHLPKFGKLGKKIKNSFTFIRDISKDKDRKDKAMSRHYIETSDIEIPMERGRIKIFNADSDYSYIVIIGTNSTNPGVRYKSQGHIWSSEDGKYPGWQDDAKEAIVQHSNAKLPRGE